MILSNMTSGGTWKSKTKYCREQREWCKGKHLGTPLSDPQVWMTHSTTGGAVVTGVYMLTCDLLLD